MKKVIFSMMMLAAYATTAQDLAVKIPKDAFAVVSVKGAGIFDLLTIDEFNQSLLGKKILKEAGDHKHKYKSVEDFGVNVKSTGYYYYKTTDSINYHCVLLPLNDAAKFEAIFNSYERDKIEARGDYKRLYTDGDRTLIQWNKQSAMIVTGDLNDDFIEHDTVRAQRYGLKKVNYRDYYNDNMSYDDQSETVVETVAAPSYYDDNVDTAYAVVEAYKVAEEDYPTKEEIPYDAPPPPVVEEASDLYEVPPPPPPSMYDEDAAVVGISPSEDYDVAEGVKEAESYDVVEVPQSTYTVAVEPPPSYYNNSAYEKAYEEQRTIKKKLEADWTYDFAVAAFNKADATNSILENADYQQTQAKDAVASFYMSRVGDIYNAILPYYSYRYFGLGKMMDGYGSLSANLFADKEQIRITSDLKLDDAKMAAYKRMYAHKPNKKFAKYINSDKMIGFASYSLDTKAYLEELPNMLKDGYGSYLGMYGDEMGMGAELLSLLLDEAAVAKVIKGDALFILNDIGPKEYSYTTYTYDDDYERKEVVKTKTETLPDFMLMFSSDDMSLLERFLKYGVRKEAIILKNGIYTLDSKKMRDFPLGLHVTMRDGIVFCGTSYRDIQQISTGTYQGNISKQDKKMLLKNNMSMLINPKNMIGKITEKEFGSSREVREFNNLLAKTDVMYARSTGIKNNKISGEMVALVPANQENGVKYFLALIEQAAKID